MNKNIFIDINPTTLKELTNVLSPAKTRLNVYRYILHELEEREENNQIAGMCHCTPSFMKSIPFVGLSNRLKFLPELWAYKPKFEDDYGGYWFDPSDYKVRYNILFEIIKKMTE